MTDFTLGRAGLATASGGDGLELKVTDWQPDGDQVRAQGVIRAQSLASIKALRDQLLGYGVHNTDEPVVPVTWVNDPTVDGFYVVVGIDGQWVNPDRVKAGVSGQVLAWKWSADLVRVPGWQAPLFEIVTIGADRSTAHAITEWSWVGAPAADLTKAEMFASRLASPVETSKAGPGNDIATCWAAPTGSKTALYSDSYQYAAPPANFYLAAARIEYSTDSGVTWRALVGRQVPFFALAAATARVRLSNGPIRFEFPDTNGKLALSVYDTGAAAWESKDFILAGAGSTFTAISPSATTLTVLRNDPAAVSVRWWFGNVGGGDVAIGYCDFTVRRGSWVVEGYANAMDANEQLGVRRGSDEAGTGVTGGIDATSADADGNKYQLRSPSAVTAETTKGGIYLTSAAQTFPFAIATDKHTGDNTTSPSTSGLYFAAMNHKQRIVAR